jgi:RimJ/RimL family protein N-acetyltransferase
VRTPTYPIETPRLLLRPFVAEDLDALVDLRSRPDVARYLYWEPNSREEVERELDRRIRQRTLEREGDDVHLAAMLREGGLVIGDVSLDWLSERHRRGEIGFVFHPDHQGKGLAREAATEMLRLGFEHFELHRIIGRCDARNDASASLMLRLGMRREAHFVQNEIFKGDWGDELVFAMLASEWAAGSGRTPTGSGGPATQRVRPVL